MTIAWIYLDKRSAAIEALKDYHSMEFIIQRQPDELAEAEERLVSIRSSAPTGMPHVNNPHAGEARLAASLAEIDVLKERYRRALEYMEWFRPAWTALTEDEQYVLSEFYLNPTNEFGNAVAVICNHYAIERSSAYNKKNRALSRLALLLYGK